MRLTKKNFIRWLLDKQDFDIVGQAGSGNCCPIARFLLENRNNVRYTEVGNYRAYYEVDTPMMNRRRYAIQLPRWAEKFIEKLDDEYYDFYVTVEEAFEVLNDA